MLIIFPLNFLIKFFDKIFIKPAKQIRFILFIFNKPRAKGLYYAKKSKIKIYLTNFKNKKLSEYKILKKLKKYKINFIALAGFMKILSSSFIKKFNKPILNIHPSLLPKYKGLNTHRRVLNNKEKFSGSTVHLVDAKLDSGKIILQKKIKILKSDNEKNLEQRILKIEHKLYPEAIEKLFSNP